MMVVADHKVLLILFTHKFHKYWWGVFCMQGMEMERRGQSEPQSTLPPWCFRHIKGVRQKCRKRKYKCEYVHGCIVLPQMHAYQK